MERVMILDEEDILKLIAKSAGVETSQVNLKINIEMKLLSEEDFADAGSEVNETGGLSWVDTYPKICAKITLPLTEIDGTEIEGIEEICREDGTCDEED